MSINNLIRFAQLATLGAIKLKELKDMPTITVIEFNGQDHTIDIQSGRTLMENVLDSGVPGIDADCGGACACGTCHCFVAEDWQQVAGEVTLNHWLLIRHPPHTGNCRVRNWSPPV